MTNGGIEEFPFGQHHLAIAAIKAGASAHSSSVLSVTSCSKILESGATILRNAGRARSLDMSRRHGTEAGEQPATLRQGHGQPNLHLVDSGCEAVGGGGDDHAVDAVDCRRP